jgi:hypothetical protein
MSISDEPAKTEAVDPIDREAATIDARSEDAAEQIAELVEHAAEDGRDVEDSPIPPENETAG